MCIRHTSSTVLTGPSAGHSAAQPVQENENILASACGDGSIKVWDVAAPPDVNPLRSLQEHGREVRLGWHRQDAWARAHLITPTHAEAGVTGPGLYGRKPAVRQGVWPAVPSQQLLPCEACTLHA